MSSTAHDDDDHQSNDLVSKIKRLEQEVASSVEKLNDLNTILKHASSKLDPVAFQAIKSLSRLFKMFITRKDLMPFSSKRITDEVEDQISRGNDPKEKSILPPTEQVKAWKLKKFNSFVSILISTLHHQEQALQLAAMTSLMEFEKLASTSLTPVGGFPHFHNIYMPWIVSILIHNYGHCEATFDAFRKNYFWPFDDIRLMTLRTIHRLIENSQRNPNEQDIQTDYFGKSMAGSEISWKGNLPFLSTAESFNDSVLNFLSDIKMAVKQEDLNTFFVSQHVGDNEGSYALKKSTKVLNDKKRKRSSMNGEFDDDEVDDFDEDDESDDSQGTEDSMEEDDLVGIDGNVYMAGQDQDSYQPENKKSKLRKLVEEYGVDGRLLDLAEHKSCFSKCWHSLLQRPSLTFQQHQVILSKLEKDIIPFMTTPLVLFDYLSQCFTKGGVLAMLSIGGLFVLIRKHNVEYPAFFKQLYSLFVPSLFYSSHRKRFLQLSSLFLRGATLPLYMVCAFLKRLSRLSLTASPQGCLIILTICYNILQKHQASQILIHRTPQLSALHSNGNTDPNVPSSSHVAILTTETEPMENDPYDQDEENPQKCGATESSLWELKCLENHYVPSVATMAQLIFNSNHQLKQTMVDIDDVADETFLSSFEAEFKRKTSNAALAYQVPATLWDSKNFASFSLGSDDHNMVGFKDTSLVEIGSGPTGTAIYQERMLMKKKRKSFAEMKSDKRNQRKQLGTKKHRNFMR